MHKSSKKAKLLKIFVEGIGVMDSIHKHMQIYFDNETIIHHLKNDEITKRIKHLDVKYCMVSEYA